MKLICCRAALALLFGGVVAFPGSGFSQSSRPGGETMVRFVEGLGTLNRGLHFDVGSNVLDLNSPMGAGVFTTPNRYALGGSLLWGPIDLLSGSSLGPLIQSKPTGSK